MNTMKRNLVILLAVAAVPLGGCAGSYGGVLSNVAVFHELDRVPRTATFSVVPWRAELDRDLEFRSYALKLTKIMRDADFKVVDPGQPADNIVYFDYGIDDGTPYEYTYNRPIWGLQADGEQVTTTVTDTPNGQIVNQTVTPTNQRLVQTGSTLEVARGTTFQRFVRIDIVPRASAPGHQPDIIYQLRLKSAGWCGSIPNLMPEFLKAIEKRFDAQSGEAGVIKTGEVDC